MNKKSFIVLSLVGVSLFALLLWYYFANTEEVEKTIDVGYTGKARQNSFLAVQRYAEELDYFIESRAVFPLDDLNEYDTILVSIKSLPTNTAKLRIIKDWVRNGGTLVTGFSKVNNPADLAYISAEIKDFLGISSLEFIDDLKDEMETTEIPFRDKTYTISSYEKLTLKARGYGSRSLDKNGRFVYGAKNYNHGQIWLIRNLEIFENQHIGIHNNIDFLNSILNEMSSSVLIVYRSYSPSIWSWLWVHARLTIFLSILFIVLWLMTMSKRFGPVLPVPYLGSRKIMEHVEVMGQYLWAGGHTKELVDDLRKRVFDRVKRTNSSLLKEPKEKFYLELSKQCGESIEDVSLAMNEAQDMSKPELFYKAIKTLKRIKDSL
ncbi:MAG: hypothetical protein NE334_17105 [Lentisphaeraceae bacterium]|nr:hypothetical protein [Lentisphaeraceae bacterium]